MVDTEIIAVHGWAFDHHIWENLRQHLPEELNWLAWDRGYFQEPIDTDFSDDSTQKVLITHSLGLHLLKSTWIDQADTLIIISGFREFHPGTPQYRKRSKAVLQNMLRELQKNPASVLEKFYEQCYKPKDSAPPLHDQKSWDTNLLITDLDLLNTSQLGNNVKSIPEVSVLHGTDDNIVPHTKGRELFNYFGDKATYYEIRNAGHSLPDTHAATCSNFIEPILNSR